MGKETEISHRYVPEQVSPRELTSNAWERTIVTGISGITYSQLRRGVSLPLLKLNFTPRNWEQKVLSDIYNTERRFDQHVGQSGPFVNTYVNAKHQQITELAEEIKKKQRLHLIPNLLQELFSDNFSKKGQKLLLLDVLGLYLTLCKPDRFLVGVRDGLHWKKIEWSGDKMYTMDFFGRVMNFASTYVKSLGSVGNRELELIPDNPLTDGAIEQLHIPKPAKTTEELLEDAYYNQRYIVPPEGAEVKFRNAGDIERMILLEGDKNIATRIITSRGEDLVVLDMDESQVSGIRLISKSPDNYTWLSSRLGNIIAEVYHDLVTAIELPMDRFTKLKTKHTIASVSATEEEMIEEPQIIYIPRIVRVGKQAEARLLYEGRRRPNKPHRVSGHRRRSNMTEKHRVALVKFEQENGISILEHLPPGYTFVRPFVSPSESGADLKLLPVFIKKRIQTELQKKLQKP